VRYRRGLAAVDPPNGGAVRIANYVVSGMAETRSMADGRTMTLGGEIKLLDDVAASLRAMASNGVAYDDDVVRWLADEVGERSLDLQRGIKAVFDPAGILNPGAVLG
jgi:FAD/FMN-containing dehydrogenase